MPFPPIISVGGRRRPVSVTARRYYRQPSRPASLELPAWDWREQDREKFADRQDAGRKLGESLGRLQGRNDVVVVGIPRGGVCVAAEVARTLAAPLQVWVAQRLRAPSQQAVAIGSLAEDGEMIVHDQSLRQLRIPGAYLIDEVRAQRAEVARQAALFREAAPEIDLRGKQVVVVDDGAVSGSTLQAALLGLKRRKPASLIVALPIVSERVTSALGHLAHSWAVLDRPHSHAEIASAYRNFDEVTDDQVLGLLAQSRKGTALRDFLLIRNVLEELTK